MRVMILQRMVLRPQYPSLDQRPFFEERTPKETPRETFWRPNSRPREQLGPRATGGKHLLLEAQQRYSSYRAILVAIVSRNSFMLVFMGYRTIFLRYVAKLGIAQMCLCETKYQGGVSRHFGEVLTFLKKSRAIWGIAVIVSQYRAIWGQQDPTGNPSRNLFFLRFSNRFSYRYTFFSGAVSFCRHATLISKRDQTDFPP